MVEVRVNSCVELCIWNQIVAVIEANQLFTVVAADAVAGAYCLYC